VPPAQKFVDEHPLLSRKEHITTKAQRGSKNNLTGFIASMTKHLFINASYIIMYVEGVK
jgi:hypothetical protein